MTQSNILGLAVRRKWSNQVANCASAMLVLLCGLGAFQPVAQAAEKPPALESEQLYEAREDKGERGTPQWRCPSETGSEPVLKSSGASPVLQAVLLKDPKEFGGIAYFFSSKLRY